MTLCLSALKDYAHVAHYLEMTDIRFGKHKIELYLEQLEIWHEKRRFLLSAPTSPDRIFLRVSEISVEEDDVLIIDGNNDDAPNIDPRCILGITVCLLVAVVFTKYKRSLIK